MTDKTPFIDATTGLHKWFTPGPPDIIIQNSDGQPLVTIHPTGELEYGPGYEPNEAARLFWEALTPSPAAELALLHEGEEPYTEEAVIPTPAQWIWKWNRATPERRLQKAEAVLHAAEASTRCLLNDHQSAIEELHAAHQTFAALHRLAAELEDAESVGGARDANQEAARRIRAALGEETP